MGGGQPACLPANPLFLFILFLSLLAGLGPSISGVCGASWKCSKLRRDRGVLAEHPEQNIMTSETLKRGCYRRVFTPL